MKRLEITSTKRVLLDLFLFGFVGAALFVGTKRLIGHIYPDFYDLPSTLSDTLVVVLGASLFAMVWLAGRIGRARMQHKLNRFLLGSAALILTVCMGMVWTIDPYAHFGSGIFRPMVLSLRGQKWQAYADLPLPPQLVVMGDSTTLTIYPSYVEKQSGLSAFNFGVESGQIEDFLLEARYIHRLSKDAFPTVYLIGIFEDLDRGEAPVAERASVIQFPYMELDMLVLTMQYRLRETFNIISLADATYVLLLYAQHKVPEVVMIGPDGELPYLQGDPVSHEEIVDSRIQRDIHDFVPETCRAMDPQGQEEVQELIALAESQGTYIVFYKSPIHPDFYQAVLARNAEVQKCHTHLVEYMQGLVEEHPGVYFVDLVQERLVTELGSQAFYDTVHLTPLGSERLVDALTPVILEAAERGTVRP